MNTHNSSPCQFQDYILDSEKVILQPFYFFNIMPTITQAIRVVVCLFITSYGASSFQTLSRRLGFNINISLTNKVRRYPPGTALNQEQQQAASVGAKGIFTNVETKQLEIAFITGNEMKAREMQLILDKHGATRGTDGGPSLVLLRVIKVDLPEIQEIDTHAIAKNKAIQGAQLAGGPCVVEDTSLQFHALGGMVGRSVLD